MKIFGSITRLVSLVFRQNAQDVTVQPNQATTYTAARSIELPAGDTAHVIVSRTSTDTLTNKTLTSPVINSPTGIVKGDVGLSNVDNTSDATKNAAIATLTNKTIDGDTNTLQDIAVASLKTVLGDADKVVLHDASGVVVSTKIVNANIDAAAAVAVSKLAPGSATQVLTTTGGVAVWAAPAASVSSFTADWVTADTTTKVVTHSLGTLNVQVQLYDKTDGSTILIDSTVRTSASVVTLTASEAPGAAGWKVLIIAM